MFTLAEGRERCVSHSLSSLSVWQTSGLIALQEEVGREIHQPSHAPCPSHTHTELPTQHAVLSSFLISPSRKSRGKCFIFCPLTEGHCWNMKIIKQGFKIKIKSFDACGMYSTVYIYHISSFDEITLLAAFWLCFFTLSINTTTEEIPTLSSDFRGICSQKQLCCHCGSVSIYITCHCLARFCSASKFPANLPRLLNICLTYCATC